MGARSAHLRRLSRGVDEYRALVSLRKLSNDAEVTPETLLLGGWRGASTLRPRSSSEDTVGVLTPYVDPQGQSLGDPPGFSLENHEFVHRLDLQHDMGESALNQSIQTEGFGTLADCNNARNSFDSALSGYYKNSEFDSVMRRDHY